MVHIPIGTVRGGALDSQHFFAQVAFSSDFLCGMNLKRERLIGCDDLHEEGKIVSKGVEDSRSQGFLRILCDEVAQSRTVLEEGWAIWVITKPEFGNRPRPWSFAQEFGDCAL